MHANQPEAMVQQYLERVSEHLRDLPVEERSEILNDLQSHVEEAISDPSTATEADVRNVLERLGSPADLAREARERSPDQVVSQPSVYRRVKRNPGALEVAAIILTALFWPIGVVLAWLSPRWLSRDKAIATVIPVVSFLVLLGFLFPAWAGYDTSPVYVDEPEPVQVPSEGGSAVPETRDPSIISENGTVWSAIGQLAAVLAFLIGIAGGPFVAAVYLAVRLQPLEEHFYPDGTRLGNGVPAGGAA